ncbi:MAG: lytic transglycosylase domain-containing protein [Chitinophagaceae bacterium]
MKKLLLFTIHFIFFSFYGFAADVQQDTSIRLINDSTIKEQVVERHQVIGNPREGFKNLFEAASNTPGFNAKLNPHAISFVKGYVQRRSSSLNKMKSWGKPYFDMMGSVLAKHGLPTELKYLSVIESELKPTAVSWAGAVGPWQFMEGTARWMGLHVSRTRDERTDFYKSTHAAARYLTHLYGIYGDWLLVIAAYNGGPGRVNTAIKKSRSRNFWNLQYYLPEESRNHVKSFIATHYIMEGQGSVTTLTRREASNNLWQEKDSNPQNFNDLEVIPVSGKYNSVIIAQNLQMSISDFNKLNPNFDKQMASTGSYDLQLPADKVLLFQASKPQILEQSIRLMLVLANN